MGLPSARLAPLMTLAVSLTTSASSLDKSLIRAVIDRHSSEVRSCYELGLKRHWELSGRLVVRLTIDRGTVTDAAVLEDQLDPEVARCVLARARTWRFPVAAEMMVINHPWVFSRKRDD